MLPILGSKSTSFSPLEVNMYGKIDEESIDHLFYDSIMVGMMLKSGF